MLYVTAADVSEPGVAYVDRLGDAPVRLLELVAVDGVVQEISEVGIQVEAACDRVCVDAGDGGAGGVLPGPGKAVARGVRAVRRVEAAVSADDALIQCALGDLVRRVTLAVVSHALDDEAVRPVREAVFHESVELAEVLGVGPGAVIV